MDFRSLSKNANLVFDTLVVDCVGCLPEVLQEIEKYPELDKEIKLILLEADMPIATPEIPSDCTKNCVDYGRPGGDSGLIPTLEAKGFSVIEAFDDCDVGEGLATKKDGLRCETWIWHYALLRCEGLNIKGDVPAGSFQELCKKWKPE